jgi:hypothetical protein
MRALLLAAALVLVAGSACGDGGGDADGACGPVVREALDPSSPRHLLPGAPEPDYATDPPTSGAHSSGRPPEGVLDASLSRPDQVAVLETGRVLLQYDPDEISAPDRRRIERLAGDDVTVAPNPDLPEAVVATAWTVKQTCTRADPDALAEFVEAHRSAARHQ